MSTAHYIRLIFSFLLFQLISSVTFNGKTPSNSYIIPVNAGDVITADVTWNNSSTDLDLHLFQPGKTISQGTSDACFCDCCGSSESTGLTAASAGNVVAWAQQYSGGAVSYTVTIKKNGVIAQSETQILSYSAALYQAPVTVVPCKLFINFTSTGNFDFNFYSPGTFQTGSPIASYAYLGNSGYKDIMAPITVAGTYDLKVVQNPSTNSWSGFTYYSGSMDCKACSDFLSGCLTCTDSTTCTVCDTGFTLSSGKCICGLANCQTCLTATTCSICNTGYYVDASLQCSPCSIIPSCDTCTSATICTLCLGASFFNTALIQCRPCSDTPNCINCDTQTACLDCTAQYYINSGTCHSCSVPIASCLECEISNVCLKCQSGFSIDSSSLCSSCGSTLAGCLTCSSLSVCTGCDVNNVLVSPSCQQCSNFIANCQNCTKSGPTVQCTVCSSGFYADPSTFTCMPCDTSVTQCVTCLSQFQCTMCDWLYFLDSSTSCPVCSTKLNYCLNCTNDGNTCFQCIDNHSYLDSGECLLCNHSMPNCVRCLDQQHCLQCEVKYHLNADMATGNVGCKLCQISMEGCETCLSSFYCLSLINDFYFLYPFIGSVAKCNVAISHCLRCSSQYTCIACEIGYFLQNNQCIECITVIDYCVQCQNRSICQVCQPDYKPYNPTGNCTCKVGWYATSTCTSNYGCIGALKVYSKSLCLICDSNQHFVYDPINHACNCGLEYILSNGTCTESCGNGIHLTEECDDGNVFNLDGCNSVCKIEPQYTCFGSSYKASQCLINIEPQIKYLFTIRKDGQNKGVHYFSIEPSSQMYDQVNFLELFQLNDPSVTILSSKHDLGRIQIQFSYNRTLHGEDFMVTFNFSKAFNTKKVTSMKFSSSKMDPPLEIIENGYFFNVVFVLGQILAYSLLSLLIVGIFFHKMFAIEIILIYQVIYSSALLSTQKISIFRVLTSLRPVFGIFDIFEGSRIEIIQPQVLRFWSVGKSLLLNWNITLCVYLVILLVYFGLLMFLLKYQATLRNYNDIAAQMQKKCSKKDKKKFDKLLGEIEAEKFKIRDKIFHANKRVEFVYERIFYPLAIFMLLPAIICYAVNIMGSIQGEPEVIRKLSEPIFQIVLISELLLFCYEVRTTFTNFTEPQYKLSFRSISASFLPNKFHKYSAFFLVFGFMNVLMIIFGILTEQKGGIFCMVGMSFLYTLYIQVYQPYLDRFHNKVLAFNSSILIAYSITLMIESFGKISELILLTLILGVFLCGYVAIVLGLYRMFLENKLIDKFNAEFILKKPEQRNSLDGLANNPYIYRMDDNKQLNLDNDAIKQPFANDLHLKIAIFDPQTQLEKVKRRLRKQVKYIKMKDDDEVLFINDQ